MRCPGCQHENPAGSNFCLGCGARLVLACAGCGADLPAGSRFCNKCGAPVADGSGGPARFASPESYTPKHLAEKILTSKAALEGERKQVAVLFADLKGSMEVLADRDPEEARTMLDPVLTLRWTCASGWSRRTRSWWAGSDGQSPKDVRVPARSRVAIARKGPQIPTRPNDPCSLGL